MVLRRQLGCEGSMVDIIMMRQTLTFGMGKLRWGYISSGSTSLVGFRGLGFKGVGFQGLGLLDFRVIQSI